MRKIIVKANQNLSDLAMRYYGAQAGVFQLVHDNPQFEAIDEYVSAGEEVLIEESKVIRPDIVAYYEANGYDVGTGDDIIPFASFSDAFSYAFDI